MASKTSRPKFESVKQIEFDEEDTGSEYSSYMNELSSRVSTLNAMTQEFGSDVKQNQEELGTPKNSDQKQISYGPQAPDSSANRKRLHPKLATSSKQTAQVTREESLSLW